MTPIRLLTILIAPTNLGRSNQTYAPQQTRIVENNFEWRVFDFLFWRTAIHFFATIPPFFPSVRANSRKREKSKRHKANSVCRQMRDHGENGPAA
jgi:hypothetical protein